MLYHVFAVVEGLEAQDLDASYGHPDRGVLEFVEVGGHFQVVVWREDGVDVPKSSV